LTTKNEFSSKLIINQRICYPRNFSKKMNKKYLLFSVVALSLTVVVFIGCEKENSTNETKKVTEKMVDAVKAYQPSNEIKVINGMLAFESKIAFDVTKLEIANADRKSVDLWEKSIGIKTPASVFYAVVNAEDSISRYYESLPIKDQDYWLKQPEVHSEIYENALNNSIVKLLSDGEGGQYFDLNLYDKTTAGVVNMEGFVIVEGQIHQYTSNAIKIILDGDMEKMEKLKSINKTYEDDYIVITVYDDIREEISKSVYGHNWTRTAGWQYPTSRKRVKVWIDGHSESYGNAYNSSCTQFLRCTFVVRAEAQKKNFWGNWKYSDYFPSLSFNANWSYTYRNYSCDPYITYGCGLYDCQFNYVPAYSCTGNPSYMCPTSPHSAYYPGVNNAYLNLTPHGIWSSSPKFFSDAFTVHGNLSATIDGKSFYHSW